MYAYLFFKHVLLKHCDAFTRGWVAHFNTGLGAKLDTRKKEGGRAGDRWHKASVWCELAEARGICELSRRYVVLAAVPCAAHR